MKEARLSAGIVVVREESGQWQYLFLRAYKNWDFPKGIVEPGEDPLETAVRETGEETGIHKLNFRWGRVFKETAPYRSGGKKVARYYLASTSESRVTFAVNPDIGKPEHHEYCWLSYKKTRDLAPQRLNSIIDWANKIIEQK
ncbi:MAG: NUDIX domain-containing protein [Desulfatiglandaceae bacterium]